MNWVGEADARWKTWYYIVEGPHLTVHRNELRHKSHKNTAPIAKPLIFLTLLIIEAFF
jgi:hypothetical protein